MSTSLATVGPHSIELRAVDSAGAASQTMITLDARDAANGCTPRARIVKPEYYEATTWVTDGTTPTLFVGEAADAEDSLDQLSMEWEARPINPSGPMISLGTGNVIETSDLVTIGNQVTEYEVRFVVSDSDGNIGVDQMRLFVLGFVVQ